MRFPTRRHTIRAEAAPRPRVICAYCGAVIRDGTEPASHGICPACLPKALAEAER